MKKLVFVAAAALAVACFADASIASANVVGYSSTTLVKEFNQITPMFVETTDNSGFNVCNLGTGFSANDSIQIFDANGNVETTLTWKENYKKNTGWHDADKNYLTSYIVGKGKCIWIYSQSADVAITQSGEVYNKEYTINFGREFNQTGNPTPVALTLAQLNFQGMTANDSIQIFDSNGNVVTTYTWKVGYKKNTGWHDADKNYIPNQVIPAGQAMWVYCQADGASMTIPKIY